MLFVFYLAIWLQYQ